MVNGFWKLKDYKDFANSIPSDIIAYKLIYNLLNIKNKRILDFGCFQGKSSYNLLVNGSSYVLGIDNFKSNIETARKNYQKFNSKLDFIFVSNKSKINTKKFDAISMTFVHPTISNIKELDFQFNKLSKVLKKDCKIIILGLHPNSFNSKYNFLFYNHKIEKLKDSQVFNNEIKINNKIIKFKDYYWSTETLTNLLEKNNLKLEKVISLDNNLKENVGKLLRKEISKSNWKDEWKAPLYQIIIAKKN